MSEFTIAGPGEYRTRDGRKVTVTDRDTHTIYPWNGFIEGSDRKGVEMFPSWTDGGSIATFYDANSADIIGPWIEPECESPAIDAGTPEDFAAGITASGEYRAAQAAENLRVSNALANAVGDYGSVAVPSALAEQREVDEARESARVLSAALRLMLDEGTHGDAVLVARAVLEVHGQ